MPAAYTAGQKQAISSFVSFTQSRDSVAARFLKQHGWDVARAVDAYYQSGSTTTTNSRQSLDTAISTIFDQFREANDEPDSIGIDGAMKYFEALEVALDEVACIAIAELLKCPSMGEFTRANFIEGWKSVSCETIDKQKAYSTQLRVNLTTDPSLFRRVYRYAFPISRLPGQRNLQLDTATELWKMFFTPTSGGIAWSPPVTTKNWLDLWLKFTEEKHKRPINKDLWEQVEVFASKVREDESLGFWNADAAWPAAVDDFVEEVKGN